MRGPAVRPLAVVAVGLVLVAVDFRTRSLDLLPDPLGWLLVALGAWRLALVKPAAAAGIAAIASLSDLLLPYRWIYVHPDTGGTVSRSVGEELDYPQAQRWDVISDGRAGTMVLAVLAGGLSLWWLLGDLGRRASEAGGVEAARRLRTLRLILPVVWVAPFVVAVAVAVADSEPFDPVWNGGAEYVALAGLISLLAVAGVLALARDSAWALPPAPAQPAPRPG